MLRGFCLVDDKAIGIEQFKAILENRNSSLSIIIEECAINRIAKTPF